MWSIGFVIEEASKYPDSFQKRMFEPKKVVAVMLLPNPLNVSASNRMAEIATVKAMTGNSAGKILLIRRS